MSVGLQEELPPVDEPVRDWIDRAERLASAFPGLASADLATRRAAALELSDRLAEEFTDPVPEGVDIDDLVLLGTTGPLRARRFRPAGLSGQLPTMLWLHGGGWIGGTIDETLNDRTCADRALRSGVQIVSLEYRLSPEFPFPAPVDDAVAALADLRSRSEELGVQVEALGIGGNSAGATIAASAALRERSTGARLRHQALEVLPAALRPVGESIRRHRRASGLDGAEHLADIYRAGAPLSAASPLDAADLRGVAPALLLVAEFDPLHDGALAYAAALRAAGVPVTLWVGPGHVHGSPGLTARWHGAREWRDRFAAELAAAYTAPALP